MRPILFPSNETTYTGHGLGTIATAQSCTVREEANGRYELTLKLPITDPVFPYLSERCLILAKPNPYDAPQPFRISHVTRPLRGLVTAVARHRCYDAAGVPILPFTATTAAQAANTINTSRALASPITVVTDVEATGELAVTVPTALWALLKDGDNSFLGVYGGCLRYDGTEIAILQSRGADRGYRIRYGKNMTALEASMDVSELYTGVLPYYSSGETTVVGAIQPAPGNWDYEHILPVDLSGYFDSTPTLDELNAKGREYIEMKRVGKPHTSIKTNVVPPGAEGFDTLEELRLWDTVRVSYDKLGVDVSATVTGTEFDVLRERYTSVEIGDRPESIARTIARKVTAKDIAPGAVRGGAIGKGAVDATKLADNSVTVNKIVDGAVQTQKIAQGAVTGSKILDQAVAYAKLSSDMQVLWADIVATNQLLAGKVSAHALTAENLHCSYLYVNGYRYALGTKTIDGVTINALMLVGPNS